MGQSVKQVPQVQQVLRALQVQREPQALRVTPEQLVLQALPVKQGPRELQVQQVQRRSFRCRCTRCLSIRNSHRRMSGRRLFRKHGRLWW
jgi:hypothetical protein